MTRKLILIAVLVVLLVLAASPQPNWTYTGAKTYYVKSNGVNVIRLNCSMKFDWRASDGKLACLDPSYMRCTATNLQSGWYASGVAHGCSSPAYDIIGTGFSLWDVYYYGARKGKADVFVSSYQDTTPPNWTWTIQESVP